MSAPITFPWPMPLSYTAAGNIGGAQFLVYAGGSGSFTSLGESHVERVRKMTPTRQTKE